MSASVPIIVVLAGGVSAERPRRGFLFASRSLAARQRRGAR